MRHSVIQGKNVLGLRYVTPDPMLTDYVSAFYLFESEAGDLDEIERADIPQLRFTLRGEGTLHFGNGGSAPCTPVCLVGPRNRAARIKAIGPARVFGMGLLPAGWLAVTSIPAFDLAERAADGLSLLRGPIGKALEHIMAASGLEDMAAAAEAYLKAVIAMADPPPAWLIREVEQWLQASLDPDVSDLLARTGLSNAQAQRHLKHLFGAPPKLLARKYRALRAAMRIASGDGNWQDYIGNAFYDQSHCIREIKYFTGITPAVIRAAPPLTQATLHRRNLRGKIAPLSTEI